MTERAHGARELLPSHEEVLGIFAQLLDGKEYSIVGTPREDSFVIETQENGERVEYDFGVAHYDHTQESLPSGAQFSASIHKTYYDGDMPISGECVANYRDGEWILVM